MSSLQKKGKSKYYFAVVDYKDEEGNRKQKWISTKCTKKSEAKKVLVDLEYRMQHRLYNPSNTMFVDFMCNWLDNVISRQVEQTTLDGYTTNIRTHMVPYFDPLKLKLQDLKPMHLQRYFDDKCKGKEYKEKGRLSANTLKKHYVNLKKALDYAVKMELIERNPVVNVSLPSIEPYEARYLTIEQAQTLLEAVKGTNIETAVYLSINYGLRRGEALGLRWSDIDFEKNSLMIQNTRTKVTKSIEKKPKTASSLRKLGLIPKVSDYLKRLKKKQLKDHLFLGSEYKTNDYVCRYADGTPLNIVTLNHTFKRILRKYNLPDIRFHDLRHSTASYLYQLGYGAKEIQSWLGHSNISTTMDIYVHLFKESNMEMANGMNKLFRDIETI